MPAFLASLVWSRPSALWLLALPLVLFFALRKRDLPLVRAIGTLGLWRELLVDRSVPSGNSARRLPPRAWWLIAALAVGAFAVAGPHRKQAPTQSIWELEVDRSPSMFLALAPGEAQTRYELALEMALAELARLRVPAEARRWTSPGEAAHIGERPPDSWREAARTPAPELAVLTSSQRIRISDHFEPGQLLALGGVASAGAAAPGVISIHEGREVLWDGARLVAGDAARARTLWIDERVPEVLRTLVELWASERELFLQEERSGADLAFEAWIGAESREATLSARGAWSAVGEAFPFDAANSAAEVLQSANSGEPLLWKSSPGTLTCAWSRIDRLEGDPASMALEWGELLDRAILPARGVVAFAERQAVAGEPRLEEFRAAQSATARASEVPPAALLSLLSLVLALVAFVPRFRLRGAPGRVAV